MKLFPMIYLPLLASFGGILVGYDSGSIGSVLLLLQPVFKLSLAFQGVVASIIIAGISLGILLMSCLVERWSRRVFIAVSALIYCGGFAVAATANSISVLLLGRIIAGVGIGIMLVIIPLYLSEIAPSKLRGRFIATFQLAITAGIFLGYLLSYQVAHDAAWRFIFGVGSALGCLLLGISFYLPEIPIQTASEKIVIHQKISTTHYHYYVIGVGLAMLQQLTGINAIFYFAPQILLLIHHVSATNAIFSALIIAGANCVFTIIAFFVLDAIGRRHLLFFSFFLQSLALLLLGFVSSGFIQASTSAALLCIVLYIFGYAVGLGPVSWIIIAEIYPHRIRGKAMAITIMINNLTAFIVSATFLTVLHLLGKANTFFGFSFVTFLGLFFVWYYVPETRHKSLDEIQTELQRRQRSKPH